MWEFAALSILLVWTWQFLNWVWLKPKRTERLFRHQGLKGSSYTFLYGDSKRADLMYREAYSKPLGLHDDIIPRLMPNIFDAVQKYGKLTFMWSGPRPRVLVMETALVREMMNRYRTYQKSFKISNHINRMFVTGIAFMEGDEWARARSKLGPTFHSDKCKMMVPTIQECCKNILEQWKEMATESGGSCVIDVRSYLEVFTSSVLARLMFSSTYTEKIKQTFFQIMELSNLGKVVMYSFTLLGDKYLPTRRNRRAKEIDRFVRASFTSMINERLEKRKRGEESKENDLLDVFMEELYEEGLDERERKRVVEDVIGQCKIFFFSGFETSSKVLCWTMIMLSVHRDWQNRARDEVFQVIGDREEITASDLSQLKIVTMIIHEMLRLFPSGMEFSRVAEEDTKLGEYNIPKGTLLTIPLLMLQRSKEIWGDDAGEFKPERFAEGVVKATKGEKNAYMPFGWGPRICIAQNLSFIELKLFVAMLVRNFSFDLSQDYVHAPCVDFTIYPQYGAPLVLNKL